MVSKALAGEMLSAGFDPNEATFDAVCVEAGVENDGTYEATFSNHFKENAGEEPDHFVGSGLIGFAGLSHNSKNLAERNIVNSMPGCACEPPARSLSDCGCKAKPILVEKGGVLVYSMERLKSVDKDWYDMIRSGSEWEVLSAKMDREAPNAAHVIALALNHKNSVVLATSHLEIMRTLKGLCKPAPVTLEIPWDRVKAGLLKTFGSDFQTDPYYYCFHLIVHAGGSSSESWNDFF